MNLSKPLAYSVVCGPRLGGDGLLHSVPTDGLLFAVWGVSGEGVGFKTPMVSNYGVFYELRDAVGPL